jgi:pimeloyl-ACP methyl ester carboxylesterase
MSQQSEIRIPVGDVTVEGNLTLFKNASGIVVFAHGSGSSRFSIRNQFVARYFNNQKVGTLLFDLLTPQEEEIDSSTAEYRFNIGLLARRLVGVTEWLRTEPATKGFKLGYFGASTGAAAALIAAAELPGSVVAVVSRGGRPDLAGDYLARVKAPTLLLVGGWDTEVIELNRIAQSQMTNFNKLEIVPEATHLFEEPDKLEEVARLSAQWFVRYLR